MEYSRLAQGGKTPILSNSEKRKMFPVTSFGSILIPMICKFQERINSVIIALILDCSISFYRRSRVNLSLDELEIRNSKPTVNYIRRKIQAISSQ